MALRDVAPSLSALQGDFDALSFDERARILGALTPIDAQGRYLPWDEVRYRQPPVGLTRRLWWLSLSSARRAAQHELPLLGRGGQPFWFCETGPLPGYLRRWDAAVLEYDIHRDLGLTDAERSQLRINSVMYESIQSSRLEGANTTREVAVEMLRDGRSPGDYGERMIANNYAAMQRITEWAPKSEPFDPDHILELHRVVTDGTLRNDDVGRLQTSVDPRVFVVSRSGDVVHEPPLAAELPERMQRLCSTGRCCVQACGSRRTCRSHSSSWAAPGQYSRAYQFVHADGNDVTHFLLHQLEVIERARGRLNEHADDVRSRTRKAGRATQGESGLNQRQIDLLAELLQDPNRYVTIARHRRTQGVSYAVAHGDLNDLVERELLTRERVGRRLQFRAADDLEERIGG